MEVFGGSKVINPEQSVSFPLDFNARTWTIKEALSWIFLGSLASGDSEERERCVAYAMARLGRGKPAKSVGLSIETKKIVDDVLSFLQQFRPTLSGLEELPPVVWSRLATQYWLKYGGCYGPFMRAMGDWIDDLGDSTVRVAPRRKPGAASRPGTGSAPRLKPKQIAIASFLLDPFPAGHYGGRLVSVTSVDKRTETQSPPQPINHEERLKKMVGPNLYGSVKRVIEDAVASGSIPKLRAKRDPKTGRFTFTGRHSDLCVAIFGRYKKELEAYAPSTRERAIRAFVVSRRSWP